MSTSVGQSKLAEAHAAIEAAHVVIAEERKEQLKERLKAVIEEGRAIDERLKTTGAELVKSRSQAEPLWAQRETISKRRLALDASFEELDFPSAEETEQYQSKRAELTDEWHKLTAKIVPLSGVIAGLEAEHERLKFARSRAAMGVNDLRLAVRGELVGTQR